MPESKQPGKTAMVDIILQLVRDVRCGLNAGRKIKFYRAKKKKTFLFFSVINFSTCLRPQIKNANTHILHSGEMFTVAASQIHRGAFWLKIDVNNVFFKSYRDSRA